MSGADDRLVFRCLVPVVEMRGADFILCMYCSVHEDNIRTMHLYTCGIVYSMTNILGVWVDSVVVCVCSYFGRRYQTNSHTCPPTHPPVWQTWVYA